METADRRAHTAVETISYLACIALQGMASKAAAFLLPKPEEEASLPRMNRNLWWQGRPCGPITAGLVLEGTTSDVGAGSHHMALSEVEGEFDCAGKGEHSRRKELVQDVVCG